MTELRVHGVGGSPPEHVLDVPYTDWVAGDLEAGFFASPTPPRHGPSRRLEAYSWGGLTSRSALRGLWVLLLPFALVNLAGWMGEQRHVASATPTQPPPWADRVSIATIRLIGLAVTATVVLYAAVLGVDLYGYQCANGPCREEVGWITWPLNWNWVSGSVGPSLAIGALLPIGVVAVVAVLTKISQDWIHPDGGLKTTDQRYRRDPAAWVGFADSSFWRSPHVGHRLGLAHTAVGAAMVAQVLFSTLARLGSAQFDNVLEWSMVVVMVVVAIAVVLLDTLDNAPYAILAVTAAAGVGVAMWRAVNAADLQWIAGQAPGSADAARTLFFVSFWLVVFYAAAQAVATWTARIPAGTRLFNWFAPIALVILALGIVIAISSGILIQTSHVLGSGIGYGAWVESGSTEVTDPIIYTDLTGVVAANTLLTIMVLGLVVFGLYLGASSRRESVAALAAEYEAAGGTVDLEDPLIVRLLERVSKARVLASMTDDIAVVLGAGVGALVVSVVTTLVVSGGDLAQISGFLAPVQGVAAPVLTLLPIAGLFLVSRSTRSASLRRGVGVLWDVASLWPRWYHPWAPPPYGERAVPQLAHRIAQLRNGGARVVVSAHSQGSVVALGALILLVGRLPEPPNGAISFITHGSPIRRLYGRFFRSQVDDNLIDLVAGWLRRPDGPGWVNLHRSTDFIGGPIGADDVDDRLILDPPGIVLVPGQRLGKPGSHFDYTEDPAYDIVIDDFAG